MSLLPHYREIEYGAPIYDQCLVLRRAYLRTPLGLDFTPKDLEEDRIATHVAALVDGRLVGCVLAVPRPDGMQIRQLVVTAASRRQGIGAGLMRDMEGILASRPIDRLFLNARVDALAFYRRLAFQAIGEPFIELTILHQRMEKRLGAGQRDR